MDQVDLNITVYDVNIQIYKFASGPSRLVIYLTYTRDVYTEKMVNVEQTLQSSNFKIGTTLAIHREMIC